jgi:putative colanic acid biosynthesis UDP-glucose lipid carrier transferase
VTVESQPAGNRLYGASIALRLADLAIVPVVALGAYVAWHEDWEVPGNYLLAILVGVLLTANYTQIARLYDPRNLRRVTVLFGRIAVAWLAVMFTLVTIAFVTKTSESYSRAWLLLWFALALGAFGGIRILLLVQIGRWRQAGKLNQNVVIIGAGDYGQRLIRELRRNLDPMLNIVGVFDRRHTRVPPEVEGIPVLGDIDALLRFVRTAQVDEIVVALPWRSGNSLMDLVQLLRSIPVNVKWCPETIAFQLPVSGLTNLGGVSMISIFDRPLTGANLITKSLEDRLGAVLLLVLLSPVLLLIAIAVRLDSAGPVLFRQVRYGFNNEEFTVYKFRTMRIDMGVPREQLAQARRNDPRITRAGRWLRRTSLDELPQLLNVLKGEMSLVGPRPHAVAHNEQYSRIIAEYFSRHRVKPGITGWAQVNGLRGETDTPEKMRKRVEYDVYYIDHWSLLFDLRILFLTLFVGLVNKNAY